MGAHYALSDTFTADPPAGGNILLHWTLAPEAPLSPVGTLTCSIDNSVGAVSGAAGSISTPHLGTATVYTLTCSDGSASHQRTLLVP
jgi:hypothetical protein